MRKQPRSAAILVACDAIQEGRIDIAIEILKDHRGGVTRDEAEMIRLCVGDYPNNNAILALKRELRKNTWVHHAVDVVEGPEAFDGLQRWVKDRTQLKEDQDGDKTC